MKLIRILTLLPVALGAPAPSTEPQCQTLNLSITASARNWKFPPYTNAGKPTPFLSWLTSFNASEAPKHTVSGTYRISATYCTPSVKIMEREDTIQLLLHGLGSNKKYWSGNDFPNSTFPGQYSWIYHATNQGFSTLAIDNLGSGDSERPDPVQAVQGPLQIEIIKNIIHQLKQKNGGLTPDKKTFKKVVMVAHSKGSLTARAIAVQYPDSGADAYILTSTSSNLVGINTFIGLTEPLPASTVWPTRFPSLDPAYVAISKDALRDTVYPSDGFFDPAMLAWDESRPYVFAAGEVAAPSANDTTSFCGPVLVITGREDAIVCSQAANITATLPDCGVGKTSNPGLTKERFPNAKFEVFVPEHTAHNYVFGYEAGKSFAAATQFLSDNGF
ncbi:Alpha/Beta hydrolase protein [Lophiotrema nucula]|uniref:Alpha/Beta hydrolase protein n=1 Tax=Lophiotrema nucula TaxID=690887 RepID=A0A6A5Z7R3_9PLEO|nr:Alpha/Beta hydrolase protein [Lophiotrema nucula]